MLPTLTSGMQQAAAPAPVYVLSEKKSHALDAFFGVLPYSYMVTQDMPTLLRDRWSHDPAHAEDPSVVFLPLSELHSGKFKFQPVDFADLVSAKLMEYHLASQPAACADEDWNMEGVILPRLADIQRSLGLDPSASTAGCLDVKQEPVSACKVPADARTYSYESLMRLVNTQSFKSLFGVFCSALGDYLQLAKFEFGKCKSHETLHTLFLHFKFFMYVPVFDAVEAASPHLADFPTFVGSGRDRSKYSRMYLGDRAAEIFRCFDHLKDVWERSYPRGFRFEHVDFVVLCRLYMQLRLFSQESHKSLCMQARRCLAGSAALKTAEDKYVCTVRFINCLYAGRLSFESVLAGEREVCTFATYLRDALNAVLGLVDRCPCTEDSVFSIALAVLRGAGFTSARYFHENTDRGAFETFAARDFVDKYLEFGSVLDNKIMFGGLETASSYMLFRVADAVAVYLESVSGSSVRHNVSTANIKQSAKDDEQEPAPAGYKARPLQSVFRVYVFRRGNIFLCERPRLVGGGRVLPVGRQRNALSRPRCSAQASKVLKSAAGAGGGLADMSRPPPNETPISALSSSLTPFGVIDFVANPCVQPGPAVGASVVNGPVVGGPPAYLEAHGIRYVPSAALEAELQAAPSEAQEPALKSSVQAEKVSQRELESRVDDRIRRFMSDKRGLAGDFDGGSRSERIRALREEIETSARGASRFSVGAADDDEALLSRVKTLQREIRDAEDRLHQRNLDVGVRRSSRVDDDDDGEPYARRPRRYADDDDLEPMRSKFDSLRSEAKLSSASAREAKLEALRAEDDVETTRAKFNSVRSSLAREAKLEALRADCEAAAAVAKARLAAASSAPAAAPRAKPAARAAKVDY